MPIWQQCITGLISPLATLAKLNLRMLMPLSIYAGAATVVFALFSWFIVSNEHLFKQWLFDYLLPQNWHHISDVLITFFFESQTKIVLAGFIINGAVVLASILLFPIKEWCSQKFEQTLDSKSGEHKEFPLWKQAIEESKLLFLYITAQSVILAIGYYPYAWSSYLSSALSVAFLFYSFGLDFIAPAFQRRRIKYTLIIKLLTKNIWLTLCFGAVFSIPLLLLSQYLFQREDLSLVQISMILFFVNIFVFTLAIPAGTYIASQLLPALNVMAAPKSTNKRISYAGAATLLTLGLGFHYTVASSMHHKSQILKCNYAIDWSSFEADIPKFKQLFSGQKALSISFLLKIENPTMFDVSIENTKISIWHKSQDVSHTRLKAFSVNAQDTVVVPMNMQIDLMLDSISLFSGISEDWAAQIEFDLLPGIPFVIELI